jgi:hypothetical protein
VTTFRETAQRIAPPWLRGYYGGRLLYSLAIPFDGLWESLMRGIGVRTPGNDPEADALTGAERRIPRGPSETDAQYAVRLTQWRQSVARKGTALELLRQLHGYLKDSTGISLPVAIITNRGDLFEISSSGTESYSLLGSSWDGTDWDGFSALWARAWVTVDCGVRYNRAVTTWHIGLDPEQYSVGSNMPTPVCAGIRGIINDWSAAHAVTVSTIFSFNDSPALAPSGWARLGDRNGLFNFSGG